MAERMVRTQILLEPGEQRARAKMARMEGRSVSDLVRAMINQQLEQRKQASKAEWTWMKRRMAWTQLSSVWMDRTTPPRRPVLFPGAPWDIIGRRQRYAAGCGIMQR